MHGTLPDSYRTAGLRVPAILLTAILGLTASGCNDTCVSFNSNPPDSTAEVHHPCQVSASSGTVAVRVRAAAPACPSCTNSSSVQHIYVGVQSLELQVKKADGEPVEWREALPRRAQPVQLDLLARPVDSCASAPVMEASAPAGVYRAVRLRLLPSQAAPDAPTAEHGACGSYGYNCIVLADGRVLPVLADDALEMPIASADQTEGMLFVFPGALTQTTITWRPESARFLTEEGKVRFLPAGLVASREQCPDTRDN